jgi:hypothetical protein
MVINVPEELVSIFSVEMATQTTQEVTFLKKSTLLIYTLPISSTLKKETESSRETVITI